MLSYMGVGGGGEEGRKTCFMGKQQKRARINLFRELFKLSGDRNWLKLKKKKNVKESLCKLVFDKNTITSHRKQIRCQIGRHPMLKAAGDRLYTVS